MAALAVLGAGAWGTAFAAAMAARHRVSLWARNAEQAKAIAATRSNQHYLPEITLPDSLQVGSDFDKAILKAELLIAATPVAGLRELVGDHLDGL